jgi:hypothetical protein
VPIDAATAQRKARAVVECFASQRDKHWFTEDTFLALMRLRGVQSAAASGFAEAFYARKICAGAPAGASESDVEAIYFDRECSDADRRTALYDGALFLYTPRASTAALCDFAREMVCDAFAPLDPEIAHRSMPVERYAQILAELKPAFIHHPESKRLIRELLVDLGCDPERTYFDVPRLRSSTPAATSPPDRLRVPSAPRHLVLRAALPAQLVAPDERAPARQRARVPPAVLGAADQERLAPLQLRRVEPREPLRRREAHRQRHARAARAEEPFDWADEIRPLCPPSG